MSILKLLYLSLVIFVCSYSNAYANNLFGFWQTVDHQTHLPTSVIAIYPYQGKIYGKIIANFDALGKMDETMNNPRTRATCLQGRPYYCGLDIVCVSPTAGREPAKGQIIDPRNGKVYTAKLWLDRGNLVLRGELMMFGRNETLHPFPEHCFPVEFQKPDLYQFIPVSFQ